MQIMRGITKPGNEVVHWF